MTLIALLSDMKKIQMWCRRSLMVTFAVLKFGKLLAIAKSEKAGVNSYSGGT
jgi:hypothetical protein